MTAPEGQSRISYKERIARAAVGMPANHIELITPRYADGPSRHCRQTPRQRVCPRTREQARRDSIATLAASGTRGEAHHR